jgi:hypothetical protein
MLAMGLFPVVFLLFAAFPQIMFKTAERSLKLDKSGWSTTIGKKSGSRRWSEIADIRELPGAIAIVPRLGNALIVPARALPNPDRWKQFVADVQRWHRAAQ